MLRVALDVNVLVSSLINRQNPPGRIRAAWQRGDLLVVTSDVIINKTDEVLHRSYIIDVFPITEADIRDLLNALREHAILTPHTLNLKVIEQDPEDDNVIIAAVEGRADCIVSGDRHLKRLGSYEGVPVLSPSEFVTRYNIT